MLKTDELVKIHLELECVRLESGLMSQLDCPDPDTLFRFYMTRHDAGYSRYFRYDLASQIVQRLRDLPGDVAFGDVEAVKDILVADHICEEVFEGKSYVFPDTISVADYPDVEFTENVAQIVRDGAIVSSCQSSRENRWAGEAWVFTQPQHRGRGYARQVTAAWAYRLQQQGKIPFYSHHRTNLISEAVAKSLKLHQYITDVGYV